MMELTDRHYRHLARRLSRHALLWTEMLTARAVIHGDRERLLGNDPADGPTVLQLGGAEPAEMAEAARIGEAWGYAEINMNVGCPSDRVQSGRFGACLMAEPELVAANVRAMREAVAVPVTVKCRLGIDRQDDYGALERFVATVADAGCEYLTVHARKAWLDGLSPKENRTVPPLRYEHVYRLKRQRPSLHVTINGGIVDWPSVHAHLERVDGVMLGRHAYYRPAFLASVDRELFGEASSDGRRADGPRAIAPERTDPAVERAGPTSGESGGRVAGTPMRAGGDGASVAALAAVARDYARYTQRVVDAEGVRANVLLRHLIALFQEVPGARQWRRRLGEEGPRTRDAVTLVEEALAHVERGAEREGRAEPRRRSA